MTNSGIYMMIRRNYRLYFWTDCKHGTPVLNCAVCEN